MTTTSIHRIQLAEQVLEVDVAFAVRTWGARDAA